MKASYATMSPSKCITLGGKAPFLCDEIGQNLHGRPVERASTDPSETIIYRIIERRNDGGCLAVCFQSVSVARTNNMSVARGVPLRRKWDEKLSDAPILYRSHHHFVTQRWYACTFIICRVNFLVT